jgi:hypothetical protein
LLIRGEIVTAQNAAIFLGDVSVLARPAPKSQRILTRHLWIEGKSVARGNDLMKHFPNGILI